MSSADGGGHWSAPVQLTDPARPMRLGWLPTTTLGYMVGDYIATSFAGGTAHPVFAVARAPSGGAFDEAMHAPAGGLAVGAAAAPVPAGADGTLSTAAVDHPTPAAPRRRR